MKCVRSLMIALVLLCPALAAGQDFPNKTIRLIVPFPPGGPNDIIARVVGQRMSEILKQPIVIDNRSGQGGVVGTDVVAKAAPDGYTIAIASAGALAISPSMEKVPSTNLSQSRAAEVAPRNFALAVQRWRWSHERHRTS